MIAWLSDADESQRAQAAAILAPVREKIAEYLLSQAMSRRLNSKRWIKLLIAIEQLGVPLAINEWFDLRVITQRFSPSEQSQVGRVLMRCRPQ